MYGDTSRPHEVIAGHALVNLLKNIIHGREYNTSGQAPTAPNPPKRKAGRPKGSTNKRKHIYVNDMAQQPNNKRILTQYPPPVTSNTGNVRVIQKKNNNTRPVAKIERSPLQKKIMNVINRGGLNCSGAIHVGIARIIHMDMLNRTVSQNNMLMQTIRQNQLNILQQQQMISHFNNNRHNPSALAAALAGQQALRNQIPGQMPGQMPGQTPGQMSGIMLGQLQNQILNQVPLNQQMALRQQMMLAQQNQLVAYGNPDSNLQPSASMLNDSDNNNKKKNGANLRQQMQMPSQVNGNFLNSDQLMQMQQSLALSMNPQQQLYLQAQQQLQQQLVAQRQQQQQQSSINQPQQNILNQNLNGNVNMLLQHMQQQNGSANNSLLNAPSQKIQLNQQQGTTLGSQFTKPAEQQPQAQTTLQQLEQPQQHIGIPVSTLQQQLREQNQQRFIPQKDLGSTTLGQIQQKQMTRTKNMTNDNNKNGVATESAPQPDTVNGEKIVPIFNESDVPRLNQFNALRPGMFSLNSNRPVSKTMPIKKEPVATQRKIIRGYTEHDDSDSEATTQEISGESNGVEEHV